MTTTHPGTAHPATPHPGSAAQLQRSLLRITLSIEQPWAIGGVSTYQFAKPKVAEGDTPIDLPILLDLSDTPPRPYVPAPSLVGALREHLGDQAEAWLGPADTDSRREPEVSPLRALGTVVSCPAENDVRLTTAIDPARGAPTDRTLRAEQVIPASADGPTTVVWWLQLDRGIDGLSVADLARAVRGWRPWIGRRRAVGRGAARVTDVSYATLDLDRRSDLTWWLQHRHDWLSDPNSAPPPPNWPGIDEHDTGESSDSEGTGPGPTTTDDPPDPTLVVVRENFEVRDPLHLGTGARETDEGAKGEILATRRFVPGSTWRGIFRHRVAHVQRVSGGDDDSVEATAARLFGTGRGAGASTGQGGRGLLIFEDSAITLPPGCDLLTFTHVAIDRVSGGARHFTDEDDEATKGALFKVRAIPPGATVGLTIRATEAITPAERRLLEAVVRDLGEGIIGVGGFTTRGYGTLELAGAKEGAA